MTKPGDLCEQVTIMNVTEKSDGYGGFVTEKSIQAGVWAHVEPVRGQERVIADRKAGVQTWRITARNLGLWKVLDTGTELFWAGIKMDVVSAPITRRNSYRTVEAESRTTPQSEKAEA